MVSPVTATHTFSQARSNPLTHDLLKTSSFSITQIIKIAQSALNNTKNFGVLLFNGIQDRVHTTSITPIINNINSLSTDVEKILNIAGSAPWIGFLAGTVQSLAGQAQAIAGIAIMIISELSLIFAEISRADLNLKIKIDPKVVIKWQILSKLGMELTIHGCLNAIRGTGVALLCSYTFGLGNVILLIPNLSRGRNFSPYFEYGTVTDHLEIDIDLEIEKVVIEAQEKEAQETQKIDIAIAMQENTMSQVITAMND